MFWNIILAIFIQVSGEGVAAQDRTDTASVEMTTRLPFSFVTADIDYQTTSVLDLNPGSARFDVNKTVLLCNSTHVCAAEGKCLSSACGCDEYCHFFNDCCKDVSSCNRSPSTNKYPGLADLGIGVESIGCVTSVISSDSSGTLQQGSFYYSDNEGNPFSGIFMVDKCADDMSEFVSLCHELNTTDIKSAIPVTEVTHGISFKNVYCAMCNKISLKDISWWKVLAQCDDDILPLIENDLTHGISLSETLRVINAFCPVSFESPGSFTSEIGTRRCYRSVVGPESCLSTSRREDVERCEDNYTAYVTDDSGAFYRNPYCFLCSQPYLSDDYTSIEVDCDNGDVPLIYSPQYDYDYSSFYSDPPDLVPISVIVDFTTNSGVSVKVLDTVITIETVNCAEGQVYDPFVDRCRAVSCPEGFSLIVDECISDAKDCTDDSVFTVEVSYANCKEKASNIGSTKNCIETIFIPKHFITISTKHECGNNVANNINNVGHFTFEIRTTKSTSIFELEQIFDRIFEPREQFLSPCNATDMTLIITCSSELAHCDDRLTLSNVSIESSHNVTFIRSHDTKFAFLGGVLSIKYRASGEWTKSIIADICDSSHSSCTLVTLNASLFTNVSNGSLFYQPTGKLFTNDEYFIAPDGRIQVCSFFDRNGTRNTTQIITFLAYDEIQIILSLVGCIISLIALLLTFSTFCMFSHLRTRAIKAIMNLVAALFTAQLVFLIGAGRTSDPNICTFMAVLLHYLWLSTFTWSNVLAYDLNRTFSNKMSANYQERNSPILKYILYGWFMPLVVVFPGLVVELCNCTDIPFNYGNETSCWIYNQYANLVVFGGPLVLCLLVNIVLFLSTACNIHSTKQNTKMVQRKNTRLKNISEELLIYVKIATLMGFTWIFAFAAAFSGVAALWYIYIIINSLQGLYIFFAFTFNARIGRLWAIKMHLTYFEASGVRSSSGNNTGKATQNSSLQENVSLGLKQNADGNEQDKKDLSFV